MGWFTRRRGGRGEGEIAPLPAPERRRGLARYQWKAEFPAPILRRVYEPDPRERQIARVIFGGALLAIALGVGLVAGAGLESFGGAVRGLLGACLIAGAVLSVIAWWTRF